MTEPIQPDPEAPAEETPATPDAPAEETPAALEVPAEPEAPAEAPAEPDPGLFIPDNQPDWLVTALRWLESKLTGTSG